MRTTPTITPAIVALALAGLSLAGETTAPSESWLPAIRRQIAESEYGITWQTRTALAGLDAAWQAPNRAQGFRTYFTSTGLRLIPRLEEAPSWEWALALEGHGRPGAMAAVEAPVVRVEGSRIDYPREAIVETWLNDVAGLAQRLTLPTPPPAAGPVYIELALGGTLAPVVAANGQAIDFVTPRGARVLHYAGLEVHDALGQELTARIEGFTEQGRRGVRIVFDDRDATYPVTVATLTTSATWTAESDQSFAELGTSLATAGDVNGDGHSDVIVGAWHYDNGEAEEGRVFVFRGSASGLEATASWTAEGNQASAFFGASVATAGDVNGDGYADVIVGAYGHDNGQSDEGRAFVYRGSATGLEATASWTAEGDQIGAAFGLSVATGGDVNGDGYADVIVGADSYDNAPADEGRAFVYRGSATGLAAAASWTAESNQATAHFGASVASAGDVNGDGYADVVVGAYAYDNGQSDEGRAFVYHGSASGLLSAAGWTVESDQASAQLGFSVATAGDVNGDGFADVLIGANGSSNGQSGEGRVFVYHGSASGLLLAASWTAEGNQPDARFGTSVAPAGDVDGDGFADVLVGAGLFDNDQSDEGRAFIYQGSASGLEAAASWTAEGDQTDTRFGTSVATAGDVNGDGYADVLVGAPLHDNGHENEGRARVYLGSASGPAAVAGWTAESDQGSAELGYSVASAGDVNGDGYADVLVAANAYDNGQSDEGRALVYHGSPSGLVPAASWMAEGNQFSAGFGNSVATAGDVNGDGYSDVIVGSIVNRAFVFLGSASGLAAAASWTAEGDQASVGFGFSVATAGDVNADGYSDAIVGAQAYSNGQAGEGRAFVYHGSVSGLGLSASWTAESNQVNASFGYSIATAGDVNGDGYSDVVIGAANYSNGESTEGRVFVYHGSAAGLETTASWTAESDQAFAGFGSSVSTAGDVNGDGYSDVIVGAPSYENGEDGEGRGFVYHGSASGLATTAGWTGEGDQDSAGFAFSASAAGDVNGDGYADVIVGAGGYNNGQNDEGRAFVYLGSTSGLQTVESWTAESDQAGARFGNSVATAGDVNGDGYADIIVGTPMYDNGQSDEGRAFVYYGNDGRGLSLAPRQRRTDGGPIAHLGASDATDSFRLALLGRSPFGRGRVKLEWEVKPLGTRLNGFDTQTSVHATDTGTSGAALSQRVSDLLQATPYHWRVRLRYDPVSTPFAQHGRWLTVPWGGWQEAMLRTNALAGAGSVPDGTDGTALRIAKTAGFPITLLWSASCLATDTDYAIYEGTLRQVHDPPLALLQHGRRDVEDLHPARREYVLPRRAAERRARGLLRQGRRRQRASGR